MDILGVSFLNSEGSACLIRDGRIIAAVQEERFTRKKHDKAFPERSIKWCLERGGIKCADFISFSGDSLLYRLQALACLRPIGIKSKLVFFSTDESFLASAFYPSNLLHSAIFINNSHNPGIIFAVGSTQGITPIKDTFEYSLGEIYSVYTNHLGFRVDSDEFRVMGLAAYGEPVYKDIIIDYKSFLAELGVKKRLAGEELTQIHKDIAASLQAAVEAETLKLTEKLYRLSAMDNLCLAGDLALNCLVNAEIIKQGLFKNVWIQPAALSHGTSLGAAFLVWHKVLNRERVTTGTGQDLMEGCFLGPEYGDGYVENILKRGNLSYEKLEFGSIPKRGAELLSQGNVVGWFQGRMEFGPRALGARSILADSRNSGMHDRLNLKVKIRENFRPFAPSVLVEKAAEYFDLKKDSPYMLLAARVQESKREEISGVVHADNSSRVQTVDKRSNPLYYELINEFFKKTGCPVIINTSFNTKNEPIVRTPEEALRCFRETDMDYLIMGRFVIDKRSLR